MLHQSSHHPRGKQVWSALWELNGNHPSHHEPVLWDWDMCWGEVELSDRLFQSANHYNLYTPANLTGEMHTHNWLPGFTQIFTHAPFVWLQVAWKKNFWIVLSADFLIQVFCKEPEKHFRAVLLCTEGSSSPHCTSLRPWGQTGQPFLEMGSQLCSQHVHPSRPTYLHVYTNDWLNNDTVFVLKYFSAAETIVCPSP